MGSKKQSEVRSPRSEVEPVGTVVPCPVSHYGTPSDLGLRTSDHSACRLAVCRLDGAGGWRAANRPWNRSAMRSVRVRRCVAPLNQCPMLECAEKAEMRAFIKKEINDGKDETAILQDFRSAMACRC